MKSKKLLKVLVLLWLILFLPVCSVFSARYYVSSDGSGLGTSWVDALGDIQAAIDLASFGDEVWVKIGSYTPHASDRSVSFVLKSGVKLYGGFQGNEILVEDRVLSDVDSDGFVEPWEFLYPSTLSGDIQNDGNDVNNSNQIIVIPTGVDASTLLNGFVVTLGYSDTQLSTSHGINYYASGIVALGGVVENCMVSNCKNISASVSYGGGVFAYESSVNSCFVQSCSVEAKEAYGGGLTVFSSDLKKSKVSQCQLSSAITGRSYGGGVYAKNATVDSCRISSCSAIPLDNNRASGGGMYSQVSHIIDCTISNCFVSGLQGFGGGVNSISSTLINTIVSHCEATVSGGGVYNISSYLTNCTIVNNKVTDTGAIGGGAYGDGTTVFYNTVFWGNQSSGTSAQLRLDVGGEANNCAAQEDDLPGANNINISSQNTGVEAGVLYPKFIKPTSFVGLTGGDAAKESELLLANWDIEKSSSLIEKGDNNGFNESMHSSSDFGVEFDLDANGSALDKIDHFRDYAGEFRLFNLMADIGAYESVFVDLILPDTQTIEYGYTLGEISIATGSAMDNRDASVVAGTYAFTDVGVMPAITGVNEKFRVSFTPDDLSAYPVSYDSIMVIVTAKTLYLSGLTSDDKQYDGNTSATYSGSAVLDGVVGSDDVSLNVGSVVPAYADKHVGVNKTVTYTGFSLLGADKNNYLLSVPTTESSITSKPISVSVLTAMDKVYDGTTLATYSETPTLVGAVAGDDVSLDLTNQSALFNTKSVGVNKAVTYTGFALTGADKGNYTLQQPISSVADVTKLFVEVTGVGAENKIYDGLTKAIIAGTASVVGLVSGDDVTLNSTFASAHFDTKNIGVDQPIVFSGYNLIGADGSNYTLVQPASVVATINSRELLVSGLSGLDKDYDGNAVALFTGTPSLNGVILSEDVSLNTSGATASYADANAGVAKEITFSGFTLNGLDNGNYHLTQPLLSGDIRAINISIAADAQSKIYSQNDPVLTYAITSGGLVASDVFTGSLARQEGEEAGSYAITQGTLAISSNYIIDFTGNTLVINKAQNAIDFQLESPIVFALGKEVTLSATSGSGLPVSFSSSDESVAIVSGNVLKIISYGTVEVTATQHGDANNEAATPVVIRLVVTINVEALRKGDKMLLVNNIQEQFNGYQWYQNDQLISGASKQYYYAIGGLAGEYYCVVTTEKGEALESNRIITTTTKSLEIYPSPAVAGANISVSLNGFDFSGSDEYSIQVYSITGDLVQTISHAQNTNTLNIPKSGIYIIRTEGRTNLTKKVIVK